ncbi:Stress responsive A/B Barrel Domain protein [Stieleria maiorica]|uniref:Stress responsive A/B Barrel Domain protein n=1 Tax=Stieleria maiorica TaxID=2795974 RepID=A0A5B9M9S5_9BACT|nr:Dabb family protein [Stieleria maiorica]QEF96810.1 Stress responsive A/B Barrel Domain protein [Stieleria maiorica]
MFRLKLAVGGVLLIAACGCGGPVDPESAGPEPVAAAAAPTADSEAAAPDSTGQTVHPENPSNLNSGMLRHAVFFSFKDSSSEEDIQGVVDAFAELPSKIDSIIDFQYGVNNSPEGLDDGFTHCFLLTFADDAGRQEYLPHPAHKAFGDVLRPHMKDVFVLDYWGDSKQVQPEKPLQHAVFFKFKDSASREEVAKVEQAFAALPEKIDAIKAFEWSTNNSPEKHDDGFTHCFLVTFDSEAGREAYLPHAEHLAFVEVLKPVLDKVRVLDFWGTKP